METDNMKPVAFHPYTSYVTHAIVRVDYSQDSYFQGLQQELITLFKENGIKAYRDNKIVFEVECDGKVVFFGFKDWVFSIGFSMGGDGTEPYQKGSFQPSL
jgi:dihydrodipicolinate synthase/N-acetylneuraminate lyase